VTKSPRQIGPGAGAMAPTAWPGDNRIAVAVTVVVEIWSEGKAPSYSPMTTPIRAGTIDRAGISWAGYGGKGGVWRLLRILNQNRIPASFCVNAKCAELFPEAMQAIAGSGHEIAAHSYTQDQVLAYLEPHEELALIRKSIDVIERCTGKRPDGWISPVMASTEHTADILVGERLLWHGDYNDIDQPCRVSSKSGSIVAIPHSDYADNRVLRGSPLDLLQVYKETFDFLYAQEPMSFLNLTLHAHFGGRPLVASVVDKMLKYMRAFPGVWFVRHDEIARWVMQAGFEAPSYQQRFFS